MAKLTRKKLSWVKERVLHGGDCLERLAFEWRMPVESLKQQLEATYDGGRKNSQYKAIIQTSDRNALSLSEEELARMRILPKPTRQKKAPVSTPSLDPTLAPTHADPMEELLRKRDELQRELAASASSLEKAEAILAIRQGALTDAQAVLQKAQMAVRQAEKEVQDAQAKVQRAEKQQAETQEKLQGVEKVIQELKEKTIYLVDPWFNGTLPEYGTFISTVEMEGVKTQEVSEDYLPEASLEGVLLFDFVPDYKKARIFVGLVAKFELEETPYKLLVSDERVKELLKRHIGN